MAIYKTRWSDRWACKQELSMLSLCNAVHEMAKGLYDADLGGGLFKKRIARQDRGRVAAFARWCHEQDEPLGLHVRLLEE